MKKYTIIYLVSHHNGHITKYMVTEGENAKDALERSGIYEGNVWFVFDGECKESID